MHLPAIAFSTAYVSRTFYLRSVLSSRSYNITRFEVIVFREFQFLVFARIINWKHEPISFFRIDSDEWSNSRSIIPFDSYRIIDQITKPPVKDSFRTNIPTLRGISANPPTKSRKFQGLSIDSLTNGAREKLPLENRIFFRARAVVSLLKLEKGLSFRAPPYRRQHLQNVNYFPAECTKVTYVCQQALVSRERENSRAELVRTFFHHFTIILTAFPTPFSHAHALFHFCNAPVRYYRNLCRLNSLAKNSNKGVSYNIHKSFL